MTIGSTAWPHLLADLEAKRDALTHMIENIRTHFVNDSHPSTMPESPIGRPARVERNHPPRPKPPSAERRTPPPRKGAKEKIDGNGILAALRGKSPQSPGDLAKTLRGSMWALRRHLKPLIKSGAVVVTGATMNRQIALAGKRAAKEVP